MTKFPWLKLRKKTEPEYAEEPPVWLGNHSNGEYYHEQTPHEAKLRKEILRRADEQARYVGMDRRSFLASSMGMFTSMAVLNQLGCSSTDGGAGEPAADGGGGAGASGTGFLDRERFGDGPYVIPPEATCDPSRHIDLTGKEFIFDVQTHSFDQGEWRTKQVAYPLFARLIASPTCTEKEKLDCFDQNHYAELMFVDSETTMSVITSWPAATCFDERKLLGGDAYACGLPLSNKGMRELRDWLNTKAMSERVINQIQVMPNDMIERQIEGMHAAMDDRNWQAASWKCYPAWRSDTYPGPDGGARGYFLTDPIGRKFIETGLALGVPNFAVHKGLPIPGFDVEHNQPTDIGTVAMDYPEANFVVYHSAINAGTGGGVTAALNPPATESVPYIAEGPVTGVNMLIRDLIEKRVIDDPDSPGTKRRTHPLNVYAEMGSAWSQVMTRPELDAQHYIGKLLKYLGEDNIVWGTDCILGGSPQAQIELFRRFEITAEFQERFGYPALTPAIKKKIFGLNAARIYRVDPERARCTVDKSPFALHKKDLDENLGPRRWTVKPPLGPRTRREFFALARMNRAKGTPG